MAKELPEVGVGEVTEVVKWLVRAGSVTGGTGKKEAESDEVSSKDIDCRS